VRTFLFFLVDYAPELMVLIDNPFNMFIYTKVDPEPSILFSKISFHQFLSQIYNVFISINSYSIYFLSSIVLFSLYWKKLSKFDYINLLTGLICFGLINFITNLRYFAPQYIIFSEFFLIANCAFLINKISSWVYQALACFIIIFFILLINFNPLLMTLNNSSNYLDNLCKDTYMKDWHSRLNIDNFQNACAIK
jgi:hypothetical protein